MRHFAVAVLLLLASLTAAGCSQPKGPQTIEVIPGDTVTVTEAPKPGNGRVAGLVGDDALYPLKDAAVRLLGTNLSATSDQYGRYAIVDVPPGIYIVEGSLKDHASAQATADVQSDQTAKAILLLPRIPPTDPYHTTTSYKGSITFQAVNDYTGNNNTSFDVTVDPSKVQGIIVESKWSGTFVSSGQHPPLLLDVTDPAMREIVHAEEPNPFVVPVDPRTLTPHQDTFTFFIKPNSPEPIVYNAQAQDFVTVFYNSPPPPGWSVLDGST